MSKTCNKCKDIKSIDKFSKNKQSPDGYAYYCKKCSYFYKKVWRQKNKEKIADYQREWRKKHPHYSVMHDRSTPTHYKKKLYYNRVRIAKRRKMEGSHTFKEWEDLKKDYNFTCPRCGRKEPEIVLTVDHIIPMSKKGTDNIDNIQPLCKTCNTRKMVDIVFYIRMPLKV